MIDVEALKRKLDCRVLVENDLGKPKYRTRYYSTFKCPFHHEKKGYSLVIYATYWRCFGKCDAGGDVIGWVQRYHGLSFHRACEKLAIGDLPHTTESIYYPEPVPVPRSEPPDEKWQKIAVRIAQQAEDWLWRTEGRRALEYLKRKRGLSEGIIAAAHLGYIPGQPNEWKQIDGLKVPCGIAIPWYAEGALWGVKVRRSAGEQRYQQVSGGNIRACLYLADRIQPGLPLFLTEGEFDALTAWQLGSGKLSVASIGSASNQRINSRWYSKLLTAPRLLVCMDVDEAGEKAAEEISSLSCAVKRLRVPLGKDMNEFYRLANAQAAYEWLMAEL